eukprot:1182086-Prorocentrum_minimum.AAC.5
MICPTHRHRACVGGVSASSIQALHLQITLFRGNQHFKTQRMLVRPTPCAPLNSSLARAAASMYAHDCTVLFRT